MSADMVLQLDNAAWQAFATREPSDLDIMFRVATDAADVLPADEVVAVTTAATGADHRTLAEALRRLAAHVT